MLKTDLAKKLKNLKLKELVFSLVLLSFFGVTILLFLRATKFLSREINRAFNLDQVSLASQLTSIDLAGYRLLSRKFDLPFVEKEAEATAGTVTGNQTPGAGRAATTSLAAAETATTSLRIAIYNSTKQTGLAGTLKAALVAAGYPVEKIGNLNPALATTTLLIKPASRTLPQFDAIARLVTGRYQTEITDLESASEFDLEIVIGEN